MLTLISAEIFGLNLKKKILDVFSDIVTGKIIKLRFEMGKVTKNQQPNQRAENRWSNTARKSHTQMQASASPKTK